MVFSFGCQEEQKEPDVIVAEVGKAKLTLKELQSNLSGDLGKTKYREEFIRNWIETELLNQVSIEENLLNDSNFNNIIDLSSRELSASIAIKKYLSDNQMQISDRDLKSYFNKNKNDFTSPVDIYLINYVIFKKELDAIKFRKEAIINGWKNSLARLELKDSIIERQENKVVKFTDIQSKKIMRALKKLFRNEISLVIKTELNKFAVVQQIDIIKKNSIPKYNFVKDNVRKNFIVLKQKELIAKYVDSLISNKNVKIY